MKNYIIMVALLALCPVLLIAQAPDTLWTKTYGGTGDEIGYSVLQTSDGGYIIAGSSYYGTDWDVYLIKADANGDTIWTRTYGGTEYDFGYSVAQTSEGGYIVAGCTESFGSGNQDIYLIKTDSLGDTLWTRTYGGDSYDTGWSIQQTSDGGYVVVGNTEGSAYLIKMDANGDTSWTRAYELTGAFSTSGESVQQTADNGYIITGWSVYAPPPAPLGGFLIKTNVNGDTIWTIGMIGHLAPLECVMETPDSGYIAVGGARCGIWPFYWSFLYMVKTDFFGNIVWTKIHGDSLHSSSGKSVQPTFDNCFIITGWQRTTNSYDALLFKTDSSGDTLWAVTYGGDSLDRGYSVQQTTDGGYIIVGSTKSFGAGGSDVWLIKTAPDPGIEEDKVESVKSSNLRATIFSGTLQLPEGKRCKVYDVTGRTVAPDKMKPGIYFIEIDGQITRKAVKVR